MASDGSRRRRGDAAPFVLKVAANPRESCNLSGTESFCGASDTVIVENVQAWRSKGHAMLLGYFVILGASIAGFAGVGPWAIGAASIALAALSYAQHDDLYERARHIESRVVDLVLLRSLANAVAAAGLSYGFGWLLRVA
jgi:hypothetical protein